MYEKIICIGEILWDALPGGLFLGGAPLNVHYHLSQLGEATQIVSRVGNDRLGREALRRIEYLQLNTELIQLDDELETGFVEVSLDESGDPEYTFAAPVAWDNIQAENAILDTLDEAWAVVFGSLVLRDQRSKTAVQQMLKEDIIKVCDINLRAPHYDKKTVEACLQAADILKLNSEELQQLITWFGLPKTDRAAIEELCKCFECSTVSVTQGSKGALLFHQGEWAQHPGYSTQVADAVGAGDAFLAALLHGLHNKLDSEEVLSLANASGAYVASCSGALPDYTIDDIEDIQNEL